MKRIGVLLTTKLRADMIGAVYTLAARGERLHLSDFFERSLDEFLREERIKTEKAREKAGEAFRQLRGTREFRSAYPDDRDREMLKFHADRSVAGHWEGYREERRWQRAMAKARAEIEPVPSQSAGESPNRRNGLVHQIFFMDSERWQRWLLDLEIVQRMGDRWWPGFAARGLSQSYLAQRALEIAITSVRASNGGTLEEPPAGWKVPSGRRPRVGSSNSADSILAGQTP